MGTPRLSAPVLFLFSAIIPSMAADAAGGGATYPGLVPSTILANISIAFTIVLLFIFGLYAYASLARFAPYAAWIYLYLISLSGVAWALFLARTGGSLPDVVFILTTVAGLNLIVHILRFDRIEIPVPGRGTPAPVSAR